MSGAMSTIESNPVSNRLYGLLMERVSEVGVHSIEEKKTSLHIVQGRAFLGIHPRKNGLQLNLVTDAPIVSERIVKVEQVSRNRFHNRVLINEEVDINAELVDWIAQAYALT